MGFLEDFWANINAGATTIATAPDPVINIVNAGGNTQNQGRPTTTTTPTPTPQNRPANNYDRPTFAHDSDKWAKQYGFDYLYGERDFRSDEDIWKRIGEDLERHEKQESRLSDAKVHRDNIETKVNEAKLEHQKFWDEFKDLHNLHIEQEGRISEKAGIDHTHNGGGGDCEFWDLGCHFGKSMEGLGKLALIGVVAFFIFMLIKKRLGL